MPTVTSEQAAEGSTERQAILTFEAGGEVERFITRADRWLVHATSVADCALLAEQWHAQAAGDGQGPMHQPDDPQMRLLLMQRLVEQGLLYRAARVAEGLPAELRSDAGVADLIHQLDVPRNNGLASWPRLAGQFDANMTALRERYAWAEEIAAAWRAESGHLELHRTRNGLWQIYDRRPGAAGGWRPCFGDRSNAKVVEQIAIQAKGQIIAPLVIEGVGLGELLPALHEATKDTFLGSCPVIYVVEPCLIALAVALHLYDWRAAIIDPRVRLFVGESMHRDFAAVVDAESWTAPPATVLQSPTWLTPHALGIRPQRQSAQTQASLAEAVKRRALRLDDLRTSATTRYRGRDRAFWHRRFDETLTGKGPPLRVLAFTSRFTTVLQYSTRDVLRACAALGCETRLLIEPDNHSCMTAEQKLKAIAEFRPDLIFTIDHTRAGQREGVVEDVPFLTWVQDRLPWLFNREAGRMLGPLDFCMGFGRDELVGRCGYPADRFYRCEMASDPAAFLALEGGERSAESEEVRFACDLAYATHAAQTPAAFHTEVRGRCDDEHGRRLLDAMHDELLALAKRTELNGNLHLRTFLERMERATGIQVSPDRRSAFLGEYLRPLVDRLLRHQTIAWAADWAEQSGGRFHLYGNGWERHPRFAKFARGVVRHGPELGQAFRAANINLHAGCNVATHQRVLDGLSAGGFFLVRRHAWDVAYPVSQAAYDLIRERGGKPPVTLYWRDLPPPVQAQCLAVRRMNGFDPHGPIEFGEAEWRHLQDLCESPEPRTALQLWPTFEDITFGTQEEFTRKLEWFLAHAEERQKIATEMRERALAHFSYEVRMKNVLAWIKDQLA